MRMSIYRTNTVTELQENNMSQLGSNQEEKPDPVDKIKPQGTVDAAVAQPAKNKTALFLI